MMKFDSNNERVREPGVDFATDDGLTKHRKMQFAEAIVYIQILKVCQTLNARKKILHLRG